MSGAECTAASRSVRRRSGRSTSAPTDGALKRAVRWGWISSNPIVFAETPPAPKAKPLPPSPEEAARILTEAWADPDWGTLVWLAIVTGVRRGELCALRWIDVDLSTGVISVSRSIGQRNRDTWEKDTKEGYSAVCV